MHPCDVAERVFQATGVNPAREETAMDLVLYAYERGEAAANDADGDEAQAEA